MVRKEEEREGALRLSEAEAVAVLDDIRVSGRGGAEVASVEPDNLQEFSAKLESMVEQWRAGERTTTAEATPQPVVTYKKRHAIPRDAVISRLH